MHIFIYIRPELVAEGRITYVVSSSLDSPQFGHGMNKGLSGDTSSRLTSSKNCRYGPAVPTTCCPLNIYNYTCIPVYKLIYNVYMHNAKAKRFFSLFGMSYMMHMYVRGLLPPKNIFIFVALELGEGPLSLSLPPSPTDVLLHKFKSPLPLHPSIKKKKKKTNAQ